MAGQVTADKVQLGNSATATQNFVWQSNADGTSKYARGNVGATTSDIITINASDQVILGSAGYAEKMVLETSKVTTSGTAVGFTGIPSWVKKITMTLQGVSASAGNVIHVQIGSGSYSTSGYTGAYSQINAASVAATGLYAAGIAVSSGNAAFLMNGILTLTHMGSNLWVGAFCGGSSATNALGMFSNGYITLGGTLDRIQIATTSTDTFDAGSVNILYEGY